MAPSARTPAGRLVKATKALAKANIKVGDLLVVLEYIPGSPVKTILLVDADEKRAKLVQKRIVLGASASSDLRDAAELILGNCVKYEASNTDLGSLDKDWRKVFHGENMPALRPQDIGVVPPPPPPPRADEHYAVGRTVEIDLPFIGDGDFAFGKRMVTISKESNGEYLLSFFVEGAQRSETVDRAHLDLLVPPGGQQQDVGAGVGIAVPGGPANHGLFAVDMTDYNLCRKVFARITASDSVSAGDVWVVAQQTPRHHGDGRRSVHRRSQTRAMPQVCGSLGGSACILLP